MLVLTRVCFFSESCLLYNHVIIEEYSPMHSRQHIKTVECSPKLLLTRVCFYSESLFDVYYRVMMEEYSCMDSWQHIQMEDCSSMMTYICYVCI